MKVTVVDNIDVAGTFDKVTDPAFWEYAGEEYHLLLTPYTPMETGTLSETVHIRGKKCNAEIEYYAPHAHYQYEGRVMGPNYFSPDYGFWSKPGKPKHYTGGRLNYSTVRHPLASARWDEAAEPTQKPKLISAMQRYIDSGRLDLD